MSHLYGRTLAIGPVVLRFGVRARSTRTQALVGGFFAVYVLCTRSPCRPARPTTIDRPRPVRTLGDILSPIMFHNVTVCRRLTLVDVLVPPAIGVHRVHARFLAPVPATVLGRYFQHPITSTHVYRILCNHNIYDIE
jgi:hypothetical protein